MCTSRAIAKPNTTGDTLFAECSALCRVSKHGHSAKRRFAKCRTRQSRHSANAVFAECQTLGKEGHSANVLFVECQALGKIPQATPVAPPSSFAECWPLALGKRAVFVECLAWHSAKRFLCRVPISTLGKVFLFFLFLFSNFFYGIYTVPRSTCSNLELFYDFLVYFFNFLCLLEFFLEKVNLNCRCMKY